ncbi:MAG: ABC transporter permease [Pseudonocardiales bacterium]
MAWRAVLAVARVELRRRWREIVVLGLLFGILGGAVIATVAVAHRSDSAYARLVEAVHRDDARTFVPGTRDMLVTQITELPGVTGHWAPLHWVGELQQISGLMYASVTAGPGHPPDLLRPVVLEGRLPRDSATDEALVAEGFARAFDLRVGSVVELRLLTGAQVARFGQGFGEPAGPLVRLRVVGLGRIPVWGSELGVIVGTPAFAAAHAPTAAGRLVYLRLAPGEGTWEEFAAGFDRLSVANPAPAELSELGDLRVTFPEQQEEVLVAPVRSVIVTGLVLAAITVGVATVLLLGQALARHHGAGAMEQRIEEALGMTRAERTTARALPTGLGAVLCAALGTTAGFLAGHIQPVGGLRGFEPQPGYLLSVPLAVGGGLVLGGTFLFLSAATAAAVRRHPHDSAAPRPLPTVSTRNAAVLVGVRLAYSRSRGGGFPFAPGTVGLTIGIAAVVTALAFGASLDRLVTTPERYGSLADVTVVDPKELDLARLRADPRVAAFDLVLHGQIRLGAALITARAFDPQLASVGTTVIEGRLPATPDEVALGPRLAEQLGLVVGDELALDERGAGNTTRLRIVGLAAPQPMDVSERLGTVAVLHPDALLGLAPTPPYSEAHVRASPGSAEALATDLERDLEIYRREQPPEVQTLRDIRELPDVLTLLLAAGSAAVAVHGFRATRRRSTRQRALLRALGFTAGQIRTALAVMVGAVVVPALALGVPLGLALARLAWWEVASASAVAGDTKAPTAALLVAVTVALLGALVWAVTPRRDDRKPIGKVLRAE